MLMALRGDRNIIELAGSYGIRFRNRPPGPEILRMR
jgi:hypothetical protein